MQKRGQSLLPYDTAGRSAHRFLIRLWSVAVVLALATAGPAVWAQEEDEEPEWDELRVLIEINGTDGDAGFQVFMDGTDWKKADIKDPNGRKIYKVSGSGSIAIQGLTENFFESAEPSCADEGSTLTDVLTRFPVGEYSFTGKAVEGKPKKFRGEAVLTHALPAIPENLAAATTASIELSWDWPGADLGNCPDTDNIADLLTDEENLFGFRIVVEPDDDLIPLVVFSVDVAADERSIVIPDSFLEPNTPYKFEVIAVGAGVDPDSIMDGAEPLIPGDLDNELRGNQTIAEDQFCTDGTGTGVTACP